MSLKAKCKNRCILWGSINNYLRRTRNGNQGRLWPATWQIWHPRDGHVSIPLAEVLSQSQPWDRQWNNPPAVSSDVLQLNCVNIQMRKYNLIATYAYRCNHPRVWSCQSILAEICPAPSALYATAPTTLHCGSKWWHRSWANCWDSGPNPCTRHHVDRATIDARILDRRHIDWMHSWTSHLPQPSSSREPSALAVPPVCLVHQDYPPIDSPLAHPTHFYLKGDRNEDGIW